MVINSIHSTAALEFSRLDGEWVTVRLSGNGYSVEKLVSIFTDPGGITALLLSAASDWRGWSGTRTWRSIEGDLILSMKSDTQGHVDLRVELSNNAGGHDPRPVAAVISLEAGHLDTLANQAQPFFGGAQDVRSVNP